MEKMLLSVEEFGAAVGVALSAAYALVKSGRVRTVRVTPKGAIRVPTDAVQEFVDSLNSAVRVGSAA